MASFNGQVQFVNQRPWKDKVFHSFKLRGDKQSYNTGGNAAPVSIGDQVVFEGAANDKGYIEVDLSSLVVDKSAPKPEVVRAVAKGAISRITSGSKDKYWEDREARDVQTQQKIQLQSSRNSAIALASELLKAGAVAGFDKAKQADKMDVICALVDHLTERFQDQTSNIGKIEAKAMPIDMPTSSLRAGTADGDWQ